MPGAARQFDDVVDLAELGTAGAGVHRAVVVAVVEHAEHLDVGIILRLECADQMFAVLVRADDDGAAIEPALTGPAAHQRAQEQPPGHERGEAEKKNAVSQSREISPPSLTMKDAPMNSRNTNAQDETIRVSCRRWPRNSCTW